MRFEYPQLLWLPPVIIPGLVVFFWWTWRSRQRLLARFIAARLLPTLTAGVSPERKKLKLILLGCAITALLVVLARPQIGFTWEEARSKGLDVIVAIDTSKSMLANDLAPSRLKRAQLAALDLRRVAGADRLGLVAFAGSAFLQCPLSLDEEAFRQSVEILDVNIIPQGGTALSEAILSAQAAFKDKGDSHKVLVIFTDGEDHDGSALESAKNAAKDGLRIFTIGVGTPNGELIRLTDVQGRVEFLKDESGNAVKSRLNEELMRQIAEETGGFYMRLAGANTMNQLYENGLSRLPKSDLASQRIRRFHERYQWLLGLVVVLLLAEMFVPERRKKTLTAAPDAKPAGMTAMVLVGLLFWLSGVQPACASAGKAFKRYQSGQFEDAVQQYEDALARKPDDPRLHFNAGTAAFQAGRLQKAYEHLNSALLTPDLKLQQQAYYNLGNTNFRLGEDAGEPDKTIGLWEQAIKNFDNALKLDPNDTDAKFNAELTRKKLEELKKQQQEKKDQQKDGDKDDKKDGDQKDQQKQDESKDDQKDQQSKDQKDQQQSKDKEGQKPDDQQQQQQQQKDKDEQEQKQSSAKDKDKEQEKKDAQQAKPGQQEKPEDDDGNPDGQPQGAASLQMTPQQAVRLLETIKADEKTFPFRPILRTNRTDRILKDW